MNQKPKTPWHLWAIGIVSLIWNAGGASDYLQVQLEVQSYLQQGAEMTGTSVEEIIAYNDAMPFWVNISWPFGVWGAIAGSLLLLLRSRFAGHAFVISLIGLAFTSIYTISNPMPMGEGGPDLETVKTFQTVFSAAIWIVTLLLIYYANRMTKAGVLR
ncbi:MAG: hypothetical protein AAFR88_12485 [Pseudomonadota bacterium]